MYDFLFSRVLWVKKYVKKSIKQLFIAFFFTNKHFLDLDSVTVMKIKGNNPLYTSVADLRKTSCFP